MSLPPGGYEPAYQPYPPPVPPPPPPRNRRVLLWIGLGVAGAALLGGAIWGAIAESRPDGPSSGGSGTGSGPGQSEVTTGDSKVVTASDRKSQITVPTSWRDVPENFRNEVAVIQLGNLRREQYVLVISASKADFEDFGGFEEACLEEAEMAIEDADVGARRALEIGGLPATQYEVSGKVSGLRVVFWYTMVEGRNGFYQVLAWTLPSRKAEAEPTLRDVINSFREVEPA